MKFLPNHNRKDNQMNLDLGGTACYSDDSGESFGITLDGTMSDDEETPYIIGDYNSAPFASEQFDELFGCCALEETFSMEEAYRILRKGGVCKISSCETYDTREETQYQNFLEMMARVTSEAVRAGFIVTMEARDIYDDFEFSTPLFILTKPE